MSSHDPTPPAAGRDDGVTTGVLAAEHRAQSRLARRRRLLIGGAALGLVIAGAVVAVLTILQQQANNAAREAAARADARAAFAAAVVDRAEDYEPVAATVRGEAAALQASLEEQLTATERGDEELTAAADSAVGRLEAAMEALQPLTDRELPEPGELVDEERALTILRELETLRVEAGALLDEVPAALEQVATWRTAVREVSAALTAHTEQVEAEPSTSDPDQLVELWEAERPGLEALAEAADRAADVPGLEAWAAAHGAYATDLLAWIDEAVLLLGDGEIDTYNERVDELFDEDPFGFDAAVAAATDDALGSPALLQVGTLQQRAELIGEQVVVTETTVADVLDAAD